MADHSHTAPEADPAAVAHAHTFWTAFTRYSTYGVLAVIAILVLMALFLV